MKILINKVNEDFYEVSDGTIENVIFGVTRDLIKCLIIAKDNPEGTIQEFEIEEYQE